MPGFAMLASVLTLHSAAPKTQILKAETRLSRSASLGCENRDIPVPAPLPNASMAANTTGGLGLGTTVIPSAGLSTCKREDFEDGTFANQQCASETDAHSVSSSQEETEVK